MNIANRKLSKRYRNIAKKDKEMEMKKLFTIPAVSSVLSAHAIGAGGLEFKSQIGQIGSVANGLPPLRHSFGAV